MSGWKKTGSYQVDTFRPKTVWERIKDFLDHLAGACAVVLVIIFVLVAIG